MNKRWVDTDMKYDPLYLFENKKSRFDKFVKRVMNRNGAAAESESEEEPAPKKPTTKPSNGQRLARAP